MASEHVAATCVLANSSWCIATRGNCPALSIHPSHAARCRRRFGRGNLRLPPRKLPGGHLGKRRDLVGLIAETFDRRHLRSSVLAFSVGAGPDNRRFCSIWPQAGVPLLSRSTSALDERPCGRGDHGLGTFAGCLRKRQATQRLQCQHPRLRGDRP